MEKKILLIDPPFQKFMGFSKTGIPIGLLYLAGKLKSEGHCVRVFDADYNPQGTPYPFMGKIERYDHYLNNLNNGNHPIWEEIVSKIVEFQPGVIGISFVSTKLRSGLKVAQIAKKWGVKKVIAGGPHVTIKTDDLIHDDSLIDCAVIGEAEEETKIFADSSIPKIVKGNRIQNLDLLPWMSRESLVGIENYNSSDLGFIMTARGCPGSCNFCCSERLWGKKVRFRSINDVVAEMDHVHEKHGTKKFYIIDDTFTTIRSRVVEFTRLIKSKGYEWGCLTRVDKLNRKILEKMVQSGCRMIKLGIETGSQAVLKKMNKKTTLEQARRSAELLNEHSVPWMAYVMVGVPGETSEDVDLTMRFIEEIKPTYVSASVYTPYIGTGFYQENSENHKGLLKDRFGNDHAIEEANHHSLKVIAGDVPREKIMELMEFADSYNSR